MKRFLPWLLVIAMLLCGCNSAGSVPYGDLNMDRIAAAAAPKLGVSNSVEGTGVYPQWEESDETQDAAELESSFTTADDGEDFVVLTVAQQQEVAESKAGTAAFTRQYDKVQLQSIRHPEQAEQINEQIDAYLRRRRNQADDQESAALEACEAAEDSGETFYGWTSFSDITVQRLDQNYISVVAYNSEYLGGAHPNSDQAAMNFDMTTGSLLSLSSIFKTEYKESILARLLDRLSEMESSFMLFDGYETTVREKFEQMPADMTQNWYLTDHGIVFFYNPYEISPYASGVVSVELSYVELAGFLRENFVRPDQNRQTGGSVSVQSAGRDLNLKQYQNVLDLSSGKGAKLVLTTEGTVYNLRVSLVQLTGDSTVSGNLILAANRFTQEDGLLLTLPQSQGGAQSTTGVQVCFNAGDRKTAKTVYTLGEDESSVVEVETIN